MSIKRKDLYHHSRISGPIPKLEPLWRLTALPTKYVYWNQPTKWFLREITRGNISHKFQLQSLCLYKPGMRIQLRIQPYRNEEKNVFICWAGRNKIRSYKPSFYAWICWFWFIFCLRWKKIYISVVTGRIRIRWKK